MKECECKVLKCTVKEECWVGHWVILIVQVQDEQLQYQLCTPHPSTSRPYPSRLPYPLTHYPLSSQPSIYQLSCPPSEAGWECRCPQFVITATITKRVLQYARSSIGNLKSPPPQLVIRQKWVTLNCSFLRNKTILTSVNGLWCTIFYTLF